MVVLAVMLLAAAPAFAQSDSDESAEPEDIDMQTKDGLLLRATFYPGGEGKNTVPIIMVHMFEGSRNDFHELALAMQALGHAVLAPDLRGHGESTSFVNGGVIEAETLRKGDFGLMVTNDMETCKRFLMERHNAGELNIDRLCVIGAEMGAMIAMNWTALDWSWPVLPIGKQGQDVKGLVLLSPNWTARGMNVTQAMATNALQRQVSIYILAGKPSTDAKRIYKTLSRHRAKNEEKDLILAELSTSLQGTKMLSVSNLELAARIGEFIRLRIASKQMMWRDRTSPLE